MLGFARNQSTKREEIDLAALIDEVLVLTESRTALDYLLQAADMPS